MNIEDAKIMFKIGFVIASLYASVNQNILTEKMEEKFLTKEEFRQYKEMSREYLNRIVTELDNLTYK